MDTGQGAKSVVLLGHGPALQAFSATDKPQPTSPGASNTSSNASLRSSEQPRRDSYTDAVGSTDEEAAGTTGDHHHRRRKVSVGTSSVVENAAYIGGGDDDTSTGNSASNDAGPQPRQEGEVADGAGSRPTTAPAHPHEQTKIRNSSSDAHDDGSVGHGDTTLQPVQLPRRLSEAFHSELSPDFLIYLNLKTGGAKKHASPHQGNKHRASGRRRRRRSSAVHAAETGTISVGSRGQSHISLEPPLPLAEDDHGGYESDDDEDNALSVFAEEDEDDDTNEVEAHTCAPASSQAAEARLHSLNVMASGDGSCRETVILGPDELLPSTTLNNDYATLKQELVALRRQLAEQCETNFRMEQNLSALDDAIGLLVHHRITVEDIDPNLFEEEFALHKGKVITPKQARVYGELFKILQENPAYIARLAHQLSISEIDDFLQTVMFSLFGTYEPREEHLLLKMFEHALQLEYDKAKGPGSVMRTNTAISRMMTTYTRRGLGQQYLKDALKAQIDLVYSLDDMPLETDPVKVYRELAADGVELPTMPANADETFNVPQVKEAVEERAEMLQELTSRFIKAIAQSVDAIPYGVRWLCKTIRHLCQQRFKDESKDVLYSHIGGFFLLRYINPAIVSPEAFGIVHRKPSSVTRKTLTQIAKLLQNIANNNTATRSRLLLVLAPYVNQERTHLNSLFDEICDVDDFHEEHHLEMIDALTFMDRTLSITPNELSSVHKLLLKYIDQLDLDPSDHLAIVVRDLPPPSGRIARHVNGVFELKLESRFEPSVRRGSKLSLKVNASTEVSSEVLAHMREEIARTKTAVESMKENFECLTEKLESYQHYLENARGQSVSGSTLQTEYASVDYKRKRTHVRRRRHKLQTPKGMGPFSFKLSKLDRAGIVLHSQDGVIPAADAPDRSHVIVVFSMPRVGYVVFSVKFRGRAALFHTECTLDQLLQKIEEDRPVLQLGNVLELDARKMLVLLDKTIFF